jgi:DNA-binding MarR family transcriptional regulator
MKPKGIRGKKIDQRKLHIYLWNNRSRMNNVCSISQKQLYVSLGISKTHMSMVFTAMSERGWIKKVKGSNHWLVFDPASFYDPGNLD